jgi:acyl-CoA synthetase (AMP-forming)/AMP-acid ligase II
VNVNVALLLAESARRAPARLAIVEARRVRDVTRTFAELDADAERAAARLRDAGLGRGSSVLVLVPMRADLYAVLCAIFRIGAVAVIVNPSAGRAYVEACCRMRPPDAVVASAFGFAWGLTVDGVRAIPKRFGSQIGRVTSSRSRGAEAACEHAREDDPALLTFTSGSTGRPKALLRTHGLMRAQLAALNASLDLREDDVDVATMPVVLLANLAAGRTSVIPGGRLSKPGSLDAARAIADVERTAATTIVASPALLERLTDRLERDDRTLPRLRVVYSGGAPVMPDLMRRLAERMPNARVVAVYGSTEAEPIAHVALDEIADADVSAMRDGAGLLAGVPAASADVRAIVPAWGTPLGPFDDAAFATRRVEPGSVGEIVVAGAHVTPGYLGGVGDADTKIRVGDRIFHRTGDLGTFDGTGRLWLHGRASALAAGAAASPFAVEVALSFDASVKRSALVDVDGRRILAIELTRAARLHDADSARRSRIATDLARPDDIVLTRIPVDARHNAKTDFTALRRRLRARFPPSRGERARRRN